MRLDNQEKDDQYANDDIGDMFGRGGHHVDAKGRWQGPYYCGQGPDKRGAEKTTENRPHSADDDHEQHQEGMIDIKSFNLR